MNIRSSISITGVEGLHDIIKPEMITKERSSLEIKQEKDAVEITIEAKDVTAFKTSFFSILKYLEVVDKIGKI